MITEHPFENIAIHTWDWKAEPNWDAINNFIKYLFGCPLFFEVQTGSDDYAVLISERELTTAEVQAHWDSYYNGEWDVKEQEELI